MLAVAALIIGGVVLLIAAPHGAQQGSLPAPQPAAPAPAQVGRASSTTLQVTTTTPTVGTPVAIPNMIVVGTSTAVTVTVQITDPTLIPGSVNLLLLGATGTQPTILGVMQSAGNGVYSLQPVFNESTTGQLQLQVSAAFQGLLRRIISPIVQVAIWGQITDTVAGFTVLYPPSLYDLTDKNAPQNTFDLESSPQGVAIGGGVPPGSSISPSGFALNVDAQPYTTSGTFYIHQYLVAEYPNSFADASITTITIAGTQGYEIWFQGEEVGNWPTAVVYNQGYVYRLIYASTDNITGFSDQAGLQAFNDVLSHVRFDQ